MSAPIARGVLLAEAWHEMNWRGNVDQTASLQIADALLQLREVIKKRRADAALKHPEGSVICDAYADLLKVMGK